jgi:hypothetical protein
MFLLEDSFSPHFWVWGPPETPFAPICKAQGGRNGPTRRKGRIAIEPLASAPPSTRSLVPGALLLYYYIGIEPKCK